MAKSKDGVPAGTLDTVVIGAGHAGLAVSYCLRERSIEHVVLERGDIGNSWRHERWDSLRLLTPNWLTCLPGHRYTGPEPDNFMTMPEIVSFIDDYAGSIDAPVTTGANVTSLTDTHGVYRLETTGGEYLARSVVIASGACNFPALPAVSAAVPEGIAALTAHDYRNPGQLPEGKVLIVGASATGLQLAEEIHLSGRPVTLAVGEHVRMPRTYRGRDIQWWMLRAGILDEGLADIDDINRARSLPSPQLVGSLEREIFDLNAMTSAGVRLVGRLMGIRGHLAQFSGSLKNVCALADLKMGRLLTTIDEWAETAMPSAMLPPGKRFERTGVDPSPPLSIDLYVEGFGAVLFATGFKPDYSWLGLPVLDRKGRLQHDEGVLALPGLYVIGLPFQRRRKSSFIHGTEDDARFLTGHIAQWLAG